MRNLIVISILSVLWSCSKPDLDEVVNLNGNEVAVFGHQGMGFNHALYMANSLEAFHKALNSGVDGLEFDVQMTKDSILVAFHGKYLMLGNENKGWLNEYNFEELSQFTSQKIPGMSYSITKIEDLFKSFPAYKNYSYYFHCKSFNSTPEQLVLMAKKVVDLVATYDLENNVIIQSPAGFFIEEVHDRNPDLPFYYYGPFADAVDKMGEYNISGLVVQVDKISREEVKQAHDLGWKVAVYNTHSKKRNREAIEMNVDHVQTDMVEYLLKITGK